MVLGRYPIVGHWTLKERVQKQVREVLGTKYCTCNCFGYIVSSCLVPLSRKDMRTVTPNALHRSMIGEGLTPLARSMYFQDDLRVYPDRTGGQ